MGDEEESGPAWVPFAESIKWLVVEGGRTRHVRPASGNDTARGVHHLKEGHWRIEYRVTMASRGGQGVILGVADVDAPAWSQKPVDDEEEGDGKKDAKKDAKKKDKKGAEPEAPPKFKPRKPAVAWGVCTSTGRLVSTHHPCVGRFGGANVGEPLVELKRGTDEMTVVIDCEIPQRPTSVDAIMSRREFTSGLHPLDAPRDLPLHLRPMAKRSVEELTGAPGLPVTKQASLSFSINGGELLPTGVRLPEAGVYPWALLTGEGDEVQLVSMTKLSGE